MQLEFDRVQDKFFEELSRLEDKYEKRIALLYRHVCCSLFVRYLTDLWDFVLKEEDLME